MANYLDLDEILETYSDSTLFNLWGRRGTGKSWGVKCNVIENKLNTGKKCLLVARKERDFDDTLFLDINKSDKYTPAFEAKYNVEKPYIALLTDKKQIRYSVVYDDPNYKKPVELETIVECWTIKDAETYKRGVHHVDTNRIWFDEVCTLGSYYRGFNETHYFDLFITTLARKTNKDLKIFLCANPDHPLQNCPYFVRYGLDYETLAPNSIHTFDTKDANGKIHKNNIVCVKLADPGTGDRHEFIGEKTYGLFDEQSALSSVTGSTYTKQYNNVTLREFNTDFIPAVSIEIETPVIIKNGYVKKIYCTTGQRGGYPALVIHKHDTYHQAPHILSAYTTLDKKPPCIYKMNAAPFAELHAQLMAALETLQVYTENDYIAQTFFTIWKEGQISPYLTI